jgi:hypothetical protein
MGAGPFLVLVHSSVTRGTAQGSNQGLDFSG